MSNREERHVIQTEIDVRHAEADFLDRRSKAHPDDVDLIKHRDEVRAKIDELELKLKTMPQP